jgi:hypothetical protein
VFMLENRHEISSNGFFSFSHFSDFSCCFLFFLYFTNISMEKFSWLQPHNSRWRHLCIHTHNTFLNRKNIITVSSDQCMKTLLSFRSLASANDQTTNANII